MPRGALYLQVQLFISRSSGATVRTPCPWQRWEWSCGMCGDVRLAWVRVRSSGREQMEIAPNNATGSGGRSSRRLSQCSPTAPVTRIVLLGEDSIQLESRNPVSRSSAGSTLSHWSLGNHSGLTQRSSDGELCCTFMWASLERTHGHLVWISLPFTSTSPVISWGTINNSWGWYCMQGWTLWSGLSLPSVTGADGSERASPERQGQPGECIVPLCRALIDISSSFPLWWQEEPAHDFSCRHIVSGLGTPLLL